LAGTVELVNMHNVWVTVDALADAWRLTPVVENFVGQLPRNDFADRVGRGQRGEPSLPRDPIAEALGHLSAGFMTNPLVLASVLPIAETVSPELELELLRRSNARWFDTALRVEAAHRLTVGWIRSRLPRYPLIPAPQLAQNTPLTTSEYTERLVWGPREATSGLQFAEVPAALGTLLQASPELHPRLLAGVRDVHWALASTPTWSRLVVADATLTPAVRAELMASRLRIRDRLTGAAQDAYEPANALRREQLRASVVQEEVDLLTGLAGEYAQSFSAVNTLIEFAAGTIFSQFACFPVFTISAANLSVEPGPFTRVEFTSGNESIFTPCGSIAWLDDQLVQDAIFLEAQTSAFGLHGEATKFRGVILDGTGHLRLNP
jgi:hypothetical protein